MTEQDDNEALENVRATQLLQLRKHEEEEHQLVTPTITSLYNQRTQARKKNKRNPPTPE